MKEEKEGVNRQREIKVKEIQPRLLSVDQTAYSDANRHSILIHSAT